IATGLGDALPHNSDERAAPFKSVVVNDMVLDANGQKMSKSKGNIVDPWTVMEKHGADAARLFVVASSQVWLPRRFDDNAIRETAGRFLLTFKNVYSGIFAQYANFGWEPGDHNPPVAERAPLDRWILSRLTKVEREVDGFLTQYDATVAARRLMQFVDDDVSKWYVRLSRARFYDIHEADNRAAFATLHEVLMVVSRLLAPFAPFLSDAVHRSLTGESVHLASYIREVPTPEDDVLEAAVDDIRRLATLAHAARDEANVKTRQPLRLLQCVVPGDPTAPMALAALLAAELNVKRVEFASSGDDLVRLTAKPNFRTLGKRFGKSTKLAAEAIAALPSDAIVRIERGESVAISVAGSDHVLAADDLEVIRHAAGELVVESKGGYFAAIDGPSAITDELRREGVARELVSRVQRMRKEAGFAVSDRVRLAVHGDALVERAAGEHRGYIMAETLATELLVGGDAAAGSHHATHALDLDGLIANVALTRVG
ncbi:MAG: DUF5915 domain-containing protein, partial [Candidatus Eremiobacteraeota bacterium]|nr:DUF5915 domain-containing protein [Candidatus Eremiobacteraeota bacterium]